MTDMLNSVHTDMPHEQNAVLPKKESSLRLYSGEGEPGLKLHSNNFYRHKLSSDVMLMDDFLEKITSKQQEAAKTDHDFDSLQAAFLMDKDDKSYTLCWYAAHQLPEIENYRFPPCDKQITVVPRSGRVITVAAIEKAAVMFCSGRKYPHVERNNIVMKFMKRPGGLPAIQLSLRGELDT